MGAFFTNIQLLSQTADKNISTDDVVKYIIEKNLKKGFIQCDNEEESDKAVILSNENKGAWISIYDEETEELNLSSLKKLTASFSKKFKTIALGILVSDSDTIFIGLFKNGLQVSSIDNFSNKLNFKMEEEQHWNSLMSMENAYEFINTTWNNKSLLVEDFLKNISTHLKINTNDVLTGFNYLKEEGIQGKLLLNFKNKAIPEIENIGLVELGFYTGHIGYEGARALELKCDVENELQWILVNHGDTSKGLKIVIAGSAIEENLITLSKAEMCYFKAYDNERIDFEANFQEYKSTQDEKIFIAEIPELIIKKGAKPNYPMNARQAKKYSDDSWKSAMIFRVRFNCSTLGEGKLILWFVPYENLVNGVFCTDYMDFVSK